MSKQSYSEDSFWDKIETSAKAAGREALTPALRLYYAQAQEKTPAYAKALIYSALAYFILPIDAIPDPLPLGYTDDIALMLGTLATIASHITPAIKRKATIKLNQWFG